MERIQKRIHQLELGEEVAVKDTKALLNAEQQQQLADALAAQVELRKTSVYVHMKKSKHWVGNQSER